MTRVVLLLTGMICILSTQDLRAQSGRFADNSAPGTIQTLSHHPTAKQPPALTKINQAYFPDTLTVYATTDTTRYSLTYNATGLPLITLVEFFYAGQWRKYSRLTVVYDAEGNNLSDLVEDWTVGHWTNSTLDTWTYDSTGNSADVQQRWVGGQWVNATRDSSTFDEQGQMLYHRYSGWAGDHWQDSIQSWRTYDENENMITNFGQYIKNGQWVNNNQSAYTYDTDGHQLTSLFQMWVSGQWKNSEQFSYTYDAKGNILTTSHKTWENDHWGDPVQSSHDYAYDGFGNMLTDLIQATSNGQWTNVGNYSYTYDSYGNELTGSYTFWSNNAWKQADGPFIVMLNGDAYSFSGYAINISYTLIHTTSVPMAGGEAPTGYSLAQNYPNPFNPKTVVSGQWPVTSVVRLAVYDVLGREVAVLANGRYPAGKYEFAFDARSRSSGVYFYRLTAGKYSAVRKMNLLK